MLPVLSYTVRSSPVNESGLAQRATDEGIVQKMVCVYGGVCKTASCNLSGCKSTGGHCNDGGSLVGGSDVWCDYCYCESD